MLLKKQKIKNKDRHSGVRCNLRMNVRLLRRVMNPGGLDAEAACDGLDSGEQRKRSIRRWPGAKSLQCKRRRDCH